MVISTDDFDRILNELRKQLDCEHRLVTEENGMRICGPSCRKCRHFEYDNGGYCNIRENLMNSFEEGDC